MIYSIHRNASLFQIVVKGRTMLLMELFMGSDHEHKLGNGCRFMVAAKRLLGEDCLKTIASKRAEGGVLVPYKDTYKYVGSGVYEFYNEVNEELVRAFFDDRIGMDDLRFIKGDYLATHIVKQIDSHMPGYREKYAMRMSRGALGWIFV